MKQKTIAYKKFEQEIIDEKKRQEEEDASIMRTLFIFGLVFVVVLTLLWNRMGW